TTRTSDVLPMEAPTFAGPSFCAEVRRIHALPFSVGRDCDNVGPMRGVTLKITVPGDRTRLRNVSKTKATALIAFGADTGTRDGCTSRFSLAGSAARTKKLAAEQSFPSHAIAV